MKKLDRKGHVHLLNDQEVIERMKRCEKEGLCYISLKPLTSTEFHYTMTYDDVRHVYVSEGYQIPKGE